MFLLQTRCFAVARRASFVLVLSATAFLAVSAVGCTDDAVDDHRDTGVVDDVGDSEDTGTEGDTGDDQDVGNGEDAGDDQDAGNGEDTGDDQDVGSGEDAGDEPECETTDECDGGHRCIDEECVTVDLEFSQQPGASVVAGEAFDVTVQLFAGGDALELEDAGVVLEPNQNEFDTGPELVESTDIDGAANFEPVIETADGGYELTATSDAGGFDGVEEVSDPFDVVESAPDCDPNDAPFGGGDGTESSPFAVCSSDQFVEIGSDPDRWDDHFVLASDIDVSTADVVPTGDATDRFEGRFDGFGHVVEGLEIEEDGDSYVAMFGYLDDGAVVENVILEDVDIQGAHYVGTVAGRNEGEIRDVSVDGDVEADGWHGGGLVGYNEKTVSSATVDVQVDGGPQEVGGLAGTSDDGATIEESTADGDVTGDDESVGGLVGLNDGTVDRSRASGEVGGQQYVGGLIGSNREAAVVEDSYATGDVDGDEQVGGLIGSHRLFINDSPDLKRCWAAGAVSGNDKVGGLVGETDGGDIEDSYWDEETGPSTSDGGDPLTTSEFGDLSNFTGWDFDDVWEIADAPDGEQRPVLKWGLD